MKIWSLLLSENSLRLTENSLQAEKTGFLPENTGLRHTNRTFNPQKTKKMRTEMTNFDKKGRLNETKEVVALRQQRQDYYNCLAAALREADDEETIVQLTAENCRRAGLPEESCVLRTAAQERIGLDVETIRKMFRVVYMKRPVLPRSTLNQKERIARSIDDFFSRRYELRYNTVKKIDMRLRELS